MGMGKCGIIYILGLMILTGLLSSMTQGKKVHYYDFVLKETNFTKLCTTKSILTINDSFPGPVIHVHKGDIVFVNIYNNGTYGVTIHWHGVKQPRNPWSDGPENITQCPIPPRSSFTQKVILSTEEGTIWWHAHSDWSRATVHGAFIILPAKGTSYPFPDPHAEKTIVIGEWYKGDVMAIIDEALATGGDPNVSDAFTINGQPGDLYDCSNETTSLFFVDYGKTYLFRIINAVMNEEHFFGVAQHNLTVVGSDAAYTNPINTDYIMITPGQTIDVLITANQSPDFYYIASTPFVDGEVEYDNSTTTAILQYNGNYTPSSPIPFPSLPSYNDSTAAENFRKLLRSLANEDHPINVPVNVTRRIYMTISINQIHCENASCSGPDGNKLAASLNNISFQTPSIDVLQAYYKTLPHVFTKDFPDEPPNYFNFTAEFVSGNKSFPTLGTKVIVLDYNESVEIVWQGTNVLNSSENHPMHLHGFSFYVVGAGSGNFNNETDPKTYNLIDPPEVNTIGVPKNGWLAMRFFADNPGVWFMHCHLERHSSWGMSTVIIVKNGRTEATSILPPPKYMPPCS